MRLIDADALNARLSRDGTPYFTVPDIDNAPTVDAVVVTRCKDCRECCSEPNSWNGHPFCGLSDEYVEYDDYCAWANRKDDNECV